MGFSTQRSKFLLLFGDPELYTGQVPIQDMNEGKIFRVGTLRKVQLHLVDISEPLLPNQKCAM